MRTLRTLFSRLQAIRHKPLIDQELDEEVQFHLEMQTAENVRRGMTPDEARYAARRQFGTVDLAKEEWRDLRFLPRVEAWFQDIRYAARALTRARGYALFAILSLALGIGTNTAVFTMVRSLVLRPLPYPEPQELVRLWESSTWMGGHATGAVSVPNLKDWRDQNSVFEAMAAYALGGVNLTHAGGSVRLPAAHVESDVFRVMGVKPILGRTILAEENTAGKDRVAVLSHGLWERQFGSDAGVVGTKIAIDGAESVIVGVMPPGFQLPPRSQMDLWVPLVYRDWALNERGSHWLNVIARLKDGVRPLVAQQAMNEIARRLEKLHAENATRGVLIESLHLETVRATARILVVLWLAVAIILVLACANVAHLVLTRSVGRRRELALRAALGAGRWRLVRLFLIEGSLLAAIGGAAGFLAARLSLAAILALAGEQLPQDIPVQTDRVVLLFCAAAAVVSALFTALFPALGATQIDLQTALKEAGSTTGQSLRRHRSALIVWEVALALILVMGALGLFRSLRVLNHFDLGFDHERVLTMKIALPEARYAEPSQVTAAFERVIEKVRPVPGISHAAVINLLPVREYYSNANFSILGRAPQRPGHEPAAEHRLVTPGYFEAMGIPLVLGRYFNDSDMLGPERVVIINRRTADLYWPGQNPIGRSMAIGTQPKPGDWMKIVGVVANVRHAGPHRPVLTAAYLPVNSTTQVWAWPTMNLVVRSAADPASLAAPVRQAIAEVDPSIAVFLVKTMGEVVSDRIAATRLLARLLTIFSGLAIVLALIGVYGVMAYLVSTRTHEIGVRVALGAERGRVLKLVLNRSLRTALIGVAFGTACSGPLWAVTRHYLIGVDLTYLWTYAGAVLGILACTITASLIPAWRASHLDPLIALRDE